MSPSGHLLSRSESQSLHRQDAEHFRKDLFNIARTTLSSKVLSQDKNYFANLAVDAVLRLKVCDAHQRRYNRSHRPRRVPLIWNTFKSSKKSVASWRIRIWMRVRGFCRFSVKSFTASAGFILDKSIGVNCPKRLENAKILIANTCESQIEKDNVG